MTDLSKDIDVVRAIGAVATILEDASKATDPGGHDDVHRIDGLPRNVQFVYILGCEKISARKT